MHILYFAHSLCYKYTCIGHSPLNMYNLDKSLYMNDQNTYIGVIYKAPMHKPAATAINISRLPYTTIKNRQN